MISEIFTTRLKVNNAYESSTVEQKDIKLKESERKTCFLLEFMTALI